MYYRYLEIVLARKLIQTEYMFHMYVSIVVNLVPQLLLLKHRKTTRLTGIDKQFHCSDPFGRCSDCPFRRVTEAVLDTLRCSSLAFWNTVYINETTLV